MSMLVQGALYPAVRPKDIRAHKVALPPVAEQRRIVAKLEELLTDLDAAVAALKRVQANLKRYRASVLRAACEGRLVPTEAELARKEGRSYETGEQLLQRILKERRAKWESDQLAKMYASGKHSKDDGWKRKYHEPKSPDTSGLAKLPEGWIWVSLDQLTCFGPQNGIYKPASSYGSGTEIIRIDDYQFNFLRAREELRSLGVSSDELSTYSVSTGDLILNRVNSPSHLGKTIVVPETHDCVLFESNMMRFRVSSYLNPSWITTVLQTIEGRGRLTSKAKWAVNQASINQQDVAQTAIPLPPVTEQQRIIASLESRISVIADTEKSATPSSIRTSRLRQSILKRAFEGTLVPQDPNDEPASVLLERIRAGGSGTPPVNRRTRSKAAAANAPGKEFRR